MEPTKLPLQHHQLRVIAHFWAENRCQTGLYLQSGALNESCSDIFGETVDLLNDGGTAFAGTDEAKFVTRTDGPGAARRGR